MKVINSYVSTVSAGTYLALEDAKEVGRSTSYRCRHNSQECWPAEVDICIFFTKCLRLREIPVLTLAGGRLVNKKNLPINGLRHTSTARALTPRF